MNRITRALLVAGVLGGSVSAMAQEDEDKGVDISGDLRLRHEYIDQDDKPSDRHRQRVRARVSLKADVNENVRVGVRVASGGDDPVSTNQSFDDTFSSKDIRLDRAYLSWQVADALGLVGGKMGKPWIGVSDLIFDGDLNPEGVAALLETATEGINVSANAGYFWLDELSSSDEDRMLYTGQIGLETMVGEVVKVLFGGSIYHYDNMKGLALLVDEGDSFGNAATEVTSGTGDEATTTSVYAEDFEVYEVFGQVSTSAGDVPVKIYGQLAANDAARKDDTGYLVGVKVGKASAPGSCEFGYNFRDLEKNAVLGALTDSDFGGGGTNADGHKLHGKVAIAKAWTAGAALFVNSLDPDGSDVDFTRVQLDLVAKF